MCQGVGVPRGTPTPWHTNPRGTPIPWHLAQIYKILYDRQIRGQDYGFIDKYSFEGDRPYRIHDK